MTCGFYLVYNNKHVTSVAAKAYLLVISLGNKGSKNPGTAGVKNIHVNFYSNKN